MSLPLDLDDIQQSRPFFWDLNLREIYFKIQMRSEFEKAITEDEIEQPEETKLTCDQTLTIFGPDYIPTVKIKPYIKQEPADCYTAKESTEIITGRLLSEPATVTKEIKQELIDKAAETICGRHSPTCEIGKFVQDRGGIKGLKMQNKTNILEAECNQKPPELTIADTDSESMVPAIDPDANNCIILGHRHRHRKNNYMVSYADRDINRYT